MIAKIKALGLRLIAALRARLGLVMVLCALTLAALALFCGCAAAPQQMRTDSGANLHWPQTPISVYLHETIGPDWATCVRVGMARWNLALETKVLTETLNIATADALVIAHDGDNDPSSLANTALTAHRHTGQIAGGLVFLPVHPVEVGAAFLVAAHELGHLLGLAHDADPGSVMYALINADGTGSDRDIEGADVDALRAQYLRR